ncbi:MAG: hypothetical protein IJN27_05475 [Oscillospiraceae bacterium]|nr:hypothetical protein [Oscillospiraceae bacterium]
MNNSVMNMMRSGLIGMAVGTAVTVAGVMYVSENKSAANKVMNKAKNSKRIITRAGENVIKEITD